MTDYTTQCIFKNPAIFSTITIKGHIAIMFIEAICGPTTVVQQQYAKLTVAFNNVF